MPPASRLTVSGHAFDEIPSEIATEVLCNLDWYSLRSVRQTCKYLCRLSKSHRVWRHQLYRYRRNTYASPLEAPINTYSASELEHWVTFRISADAGWSSPHVTKPTFTRFIEQRTAFGLCIVPGGRWLLTGSRDGLVTAYDLDSPKPKGVVLVRLSKFDAILHISVEIDDQAPYLRFTMAVTMHGGLSREAWMPSIHILAVDLVGHGQDAQLESRPLRSFNAYMLGSTMCLCLRSNLVARLSFSSAYIVEVFDWKKSSSTTHSKAVIILNLNELIQEIRLLPDNRLLVLSTAAINIYDIFINEDQDASLPATRSGQEPTWTYQTRWLLCAISPPLSDETGIRFTFATERSMFALVVPHDDTQSSWVSELWQISTTIRRESVIIGFRKMLADRLSTGILRLGFDWREYGESIEGGVVSSIVTDNDIVEFSLLPFAFDEYTGRVVHTAAHRGVYVKDTAFCASYET